MLGAFLNMAERDFLAFGAWVVTLPLPFQYFAVVVFVLVFAGAAAFQIAFLLALINCLIKSSRHIADIPGDTAALVDETTTSILGRPKDKKQE
jgi:hypothetical protein